MFGKPVFATCPVCLVAVGGGLAIAEKLGVDDLIASIWIGALVTALAIALGEKFRLIKLPKPKISWTIVFYLIIVATLWIQGKLNNPGCRIWGVCKIWLGATMGTIFLWIGAGLDLFLRKKNQGKAFFPFQKVILPLGSILIISLFFYSLIC